MKYAEKQFELNAKTRANWDSFENHRNQTTAAICDAKKYISFNNAEPSIAILGCGNGNDLDLQRIAKTFAKIHLFDFDPEALEHLKSQQIESQETGDPEILDRVIVEPPVDLTGISVDLDNLPATLNEAQVIKLAEKARQVKDVLRGRKFDVVVSTSLVTQLLHSVVNSFGDDSKYKNPMMLAVRDGHLQLLANLIGPKGCGVLVSDFVSSDTLPELATAVTSESVLAASRKAINERNFFTGTNPWAVKDALAKLIE